LALIIQGVLIVLPLQVSSFSKSNRSLFLCIFIVAAWDRSVTPVKVNHSTRRASGYFWHAVTVSLSSASR